VYSIILCSNFFVVDDMQGWGVRDVTFVDNGVVSMSNLVRQPLYRFEDVKQPKADIAANNLQQILPSMVIIIFYVNDPELLIMIFLNFHPYLLVYQRFSQIHKIN
jgi:hypothetical protein